MTEVFTARDGVFSVEGGAKIFEVAPRFKRGSHVTLLTKYKISYKLHSLLQEALTDRQLVKWMDHVHFF